MPLPMMLLLAPFVKLGNINQMLLQQNIRVKFVLPVPMRQPPKKQPVTFAVLANIRRPPNERPIVIKGALLVNISVTPTLQTNTME